MCFREIISGGGLSGQRGWNNLAWLLFSEIIAATEGRSGTKIALSTGHANWILDYQSWV